MSARLRHEAFQVMHGRPIPVFLAAWALAGLGAVIGSILGNAAGKTGLFAGAVVGGVVGVGAAVSRDGGLSRGRFRG